MTSRHSGPAMVTAGEGIQLIQIHFQYFHQKINNINIKIKNKMVEPSFVSTIGLPTSCQDRRAVKVNEVTSNASSDPRLMKLSFNLERIIFIIIEKSIRGKGE